MKAQKGLGLIEVLISLLILGVGLLGLLGMQATALKQSQENFRYNQANMLAQDYFNRIIANADAALDDVTLYEVELTDTASNQVRDCSQNTCSQTQMAAYDVDQWLTLLGNADYLVGGQALVDISKDSSGDFVNVSLTIRFLNEFGAESQTIAQVEGQDASLYEQFVFERNI